MTHPPKTEHDFVSVPTPALLEIIKRVRRLSEGPMTLFDEDRVEICVRATGEEIKRWSAMLAAAPAQVSADAFERVERVRKAARSILSQRWQCAEGRWDADDWIETDEPRRFAESALAAIAALSHPASPVTDPFAGVEVEPHLLEPSA